jgi:hypothetical protein
MDHTPDEYQQYLTEALPAPLLRAMLLAVIDGYRAAPSAAKKALDLPDRHDGLGMIRRGKLNEQLRGVAEFHQLEKKDEPNSNGSSFFLSIFAGKFRVVAGLVARRKQMVRPAKIRKLWAHHNRDSQRALGFMPTPTAVPEDARFLAILIHGPRGRRRDQPAFVDIVVPDLRFQRYMCRLDLFSMFPEIALTLVGQRSPARKEPNQRKYRRAHGA